MNQARSRTARRLLGGLSLLGAAACGSGGTGDGTTDAAATGGAFVGTGGQDGGESTGGVVGSGGAVGSTGGEANAATGGVGSGGAPATSGGAPASGGDVGSGGTPDDGPPAAPEGVIPNEAYPESVASPSKSNWQDGLISPTLESEHHNQPAVINGYLQITGNSMFSLYDISDPTAPALLSTNESPDYCTPCGEAEGHQVSFAKYGDRLLTVTIQGKGVDFWDITDARNPELLKTVYIQGINYGDFTEAVWGVAWQGRHVFVGGTNTGVHVIDATEPENAALVGKLTNLAGVSAGPLFPVGNVLVVTTPKDNAGVATLDISDPTKPVLLKSLLPNENSYIGAFYRHHAYLLNPLRVYDVLSNPTEITLVSGSRPGGYFEYLSFQDDFAFAGRIRPEPGATKINVSNISNFTFVKDIYGRRNLQENDDQFTVGIGNLLVLSDDQLSPATNKYAGTVIAVHDSQPDTKPPVVDTIIPKNGATGQPTTSRIGISFTDNIELATVDHRSFIVREQGGANVPGKWGVNMTLLHFEPDDGFKPGTTYEVVLPAGGVKDLVGNGIAEEFTSTFTTK